MATELKRGQEVWGEECTGRDAAGNRLHPRHLCREGRDFGDSDQFLPAPEHLRDKIRYVLDTIDPALANWMRDMTRWAERVRDDIVMLEMECGIKRRGDPGNPPPGPWK